MPLYEGTLWIRLLSACQTGRDQHATTIVRKKATVWNAQMRFCCSRCFVVGRRTSTILSVFCCLRVDNLGFAEVSRNGTRLGGGVGDVGTLLRECFRPNICAYTYPKNVPVVEERCPSAMKVLGLEGPCRTDVWLAPHPSSFLFPSPVLPDHVVRSLVTTMIVFSS